MSTPIDIALTQDDLGMFDISLSGGDFATTNGFDTALPMSLYCERRAASSEVSASENRRGWWGNTLNVDGFEIGSKLWLLDQERRTQATLNRAKDYAKSALQWLVDDGHLNSVNVSGTFTASGISIRLTLNRSASISDSASYELWENTSGF